MLLGGVAPAVSALALSPASDRNLAEKMRRGPGLSNHPVNVIPSRAVTLPTGWPLAFDGSMTCFTCHEDMPSLNGGSGPRLRGVDGSVANSEAFCENCHGDGHERTAAAMHWMAVPRAHITSDSDRDTGQIGFGGVDSASRRCLGCHDGVTAGESAYELGGTGGGSSFGDRGRNHPIGVSYPRGGRRRAEVPLRAAAQVPSHVRLPDGMVGCVSCHDLYNQTPKRLAVPIEGSRLCFACHDMN